MSTAGDERQRGLDSEAGEIVQARERRRRPMTQRELAWGVGRSVAFLVAALLMAYLARDAAGPGPDVVVLLIAVYALAWRVEFETPTGVTVPSVLAICPMLVLLPAGWVPLAALVGGLLGDVWTSDQRARRLLGTFWCTWPVVPPSLLVWAADPSPTWESAPLYVTAIALWVLCDAASMWLHQRVVAGNESAEMPAILAMYWIEIPLGMLALLGALASEEFRYAFLLPLAVLGMFQRLARERMHRVVQASELSQAYRGTAILLGTVIDANDAYTGFHSRGVVELATAVAQELDLDEADLRRTELAALLHDVGKIHTPKSILHKPGPLTEEEWEVVRRHPVDGAAMLAEVGGALTEVGEIIRHHHERWDGAGYPDGLAADEIPLVARVICACDAFSAMTTDRPYRRTLSVEAALAELRNCSLSQFDPVVVDAVCRVVRSGRSGQPDVREAA